MIKLGVSTHGWDAGQRLFDVPFEVTGNMSFRFPLSGAFLLLLVLVLTGLHCRAQIPDAKKQNIAQGFIIWSMWIVVATRLSPGCADLTTEPNRSDAAIANSKKSGE
jgi:hypothetical protein